MPVDPKQSDTRTDVDAGSSARRERSEVPELGLLPVSSDVSDKHEHTDETLRRLNAELSEQAAHLRAVNQTLFDREQRLRLAIATGKIGLWVWNSTDVSNSGDWSPRLKEIFGLPMDAAVTHEAFLKCVHPEDRERVDAAVMQALTGANGGEYCAEYRTIHPEDGSKHWVTARGQAFFNQEGQAIRFIGTVMDITDRKHAEETLRQENTDLEERIQERTREIAAEKEQFVLAVDTIPGLVWISQPDGSIDFLNLRWRDYTGMTLAEACGWGWRAAIHPDDLPGLENYWSSVLQSGKPGETEARLKRFDGVYRWHLFQSVPLYDASGALLKWYGQTIDIDDRKCAEHHLQRSENYLAAAQKLSRTGSFGWNTSSGKLVWSDETFCLLGYNRSIVPTLELVFDRVHPDDRAFVREQVDRAAQERTEMDFVHQVLLSDQSVRHVHVRARPMPMSGGPVEFVGAVMDITAQKLAAEALRSSEHLARGQLSALTRTLDSLSQESDPDQLPRHVLEIILSQFGAHSVSIWERKGEMLNVIGVIEEGEFRSRLEVGFSQGNLPLSGETPPLWSEALYGCQHILIEEIDREPSRVVTGDGRNALWPEAELPPAFACIKAHLATRGVRALLIAPLVVGGNVAGIIGIRFTGTRVLKQEEIDLTQALAHQAMLAIQLMRLSQQSREAAVLAERTRMARDLHDTLAQGFTGVIVQLEAAEDAWSKGLLEESGKHFTRARALARDSLQEARRCAQGLRSPALAEKDLGVAISDLIKTTTGGTNVQGAFEVTGAAWPLPEHWEENLLRISQEVLTNTLRHARARHFHARLTFEPQRIRLELRDDGQGFNTRAGHEGLGVLGITERVQAMGGVLDIESSLGQGTAVLVTLPAIGINPSTPFAP